MKKISLALLFAISLNLPFFSPQAQAQLTRYCQFPLKVIAFKDQLRNAAFKGNAKQQKAYQDLITKHGFILRQCRQESWPQEQAIWLRVYPCDLRPGVLDTLLDQIVNNGYSRIYVEVFFNSQVLLPKADNPTLWPSIVQEKKWEKADLLAQVIKKGRERGLQVYAWMFTMNFGYAYSQNPDRQWVLAKNGFGQTSTEVVSDQVQTFIDPYNPIAQSDYAKMLQAVLKRRPDGVLFDYIRYPRGVAGKTAVGHIKDLWVYSDASYQTLLNRGMNQKGRFLIQKYLEQGYVTITDIANADRQFTKEGSPLWVGRKPPSGEMKQTPEQRKSRIDQDLWNLAVAHAANGVIDFLGRSANLARKQGIKAGAVFFPDANQGVGNVGFDARLQAWDRFPRFIEWHPMAYAVCNNPRCVVSQIQRVTRVAKNKTVVIPAIAGIWGVSQPNRPSLQEQMQAIQAGNPTIQAISHFAYSWQDPKFDRQRRDCRF